MLANLVSLSSGEVIIAAGFVDMLGVAQKAYHRDGRNKDSGYDYQSVCRGGFAQGDTTTATTQVGTQYALNVTADAIGVDLASTTADGGVVIETLDPRDGAHTGSGGRLIVRFAGGACVMDGVGAA